MPKLKTHKGTAKRVKKTGSGKLMRRHANGNHLLSKKSAGRKRTIGNAHKVSAADKGNVKRALGK
jgi:large subunit ribosomal protein L35